MIKNPSALDLARRYHESWNDHNTKTLMEFFSKGGIYSNPDTNPGITGSALVAHLDALWILVPDLHLEILDAGEIQPNLVAHHWTCTGTVAVTRPEGGNPIPRSFAFQGASIIKIEGNKIASDYVYYDRKGIDEQIAAES